MHLHEVMGWPGPMTHLQFMVWMRWLRKRWERPSLSDHYQMQTACEVRRVLARNRRAIKLEHFKLGFGGHTKKPLSDQQKKNIMAVSKARWIAAMGMPVTVVDGSGTGANGSQVDGGRDRLPVHVG